MSQTPNTAIAVIGIDICKNSFHVVGHDARGAIVLRQKWSRGQVEARLANIPPCLIGMEACVGAHHLSRKLASLGHDARLMPAKYVRQPFGMLEAEQRAPRSAGFLELLGQRYPSPQLDVAPSFCERADAHARQGRPLPRFAQSHELLPV